MTQIDAVGRTSPVDRYIPNPAVVFKELDGELVLLNLDSGVYFGLDSVGTRVWSLLGQGVDVRGVCAQMLEEFDVASDVLERDVLGLIEELRGQNLVVLAGVDGAGS